MILASNQVLVDTNIVLRLGGSRFPSADAINRTISKLVSRGFRPCVSAQSLTEAWAVLTRPQSANGLGLEPARARLEVDRIRAVFPLLADPPALFPTWLDLCTTHAVCGRQVYGARLVALMIACGITHFVTLNSSDFTRYSMLRIIVPGAGDEQA